MDWQTRLVGLYCSICNAFDKGLSMVAARASRYSKPQFTDEEVITIYYFGIQTRLAALKDIYYFCSEYLGDFFPKLPGYKQFCRRLNRLALVMKEHFARLVQPGEFDGQIGYLMDSFPVVLSKRTDRKKPRVLDEMAAPGYCATKKMHYYGAKVHVIAERALGKTPTPYVVYHLPANVQDLNAFKQVSSYICNAYIYADKAYIDRSFQEDLFNNQNTTLATPIRKGREIPFTSYETLHNYLMAHTRQPIEALFSRIQRHTRIQEASRVRSIPGFISHVYGRLAAMLCSAA